jgi:hypothetical protein
MEIAVNLKNPAQLFAAAGIAFLLNVPSRFTVREHEGEPTYSAALVLPDSDLRAILSDLKGALVTEQSEADGTVYSFDAYSRPVLLTLPGKIIKLDWWLNEFWSHKCRLNNWAGTTAPLSILRRLSSMIDPDATDILNYGVLTPAGNRPTWGFDPRVTRNTGVAGRLSTVRVYPITEFLCAFGLQYFRPLVTSNEIIFHLWRDELPVELATIAGDWEAVRTLALTARREKHSQGTCKFSPAEFVANRAALQAPRVFAQ